MTDDTPRTDACPHCGCQTKDPFGMGKTIHNVEGCKRNRQLAEVILIVGLTPVTGNKEALQEAFNLTRKALNTTDK